jgi:uncharacterized protein
MYEVSARRLIVIYRLEIENFYSFRDRQVVDLTVPRNVRDHSERFAPLFENSKLRAPKVVALFGANASGKSTVLKSLTFLVWLLRDSAKYAGHDVPCQRFNDRISADRPVSIAVELGGLSPLTSHGETEQGIFRYEIELATDNGAVASVAKETLRFKRNGQGKWTRIFDRRGNDKVLGSKRFPLSGYSHVIKKVRPNTSIVATLAFFEHEPAQNIVSLLTSVMSNIWFDKSELQLQNTVKYLHESPDVLAQLNDEIQRIDLGIRNMRIIDTATGPVPQFVHEGLQSDMPWHLESHGTRSFIQMYPLVRFALEQGGLAIIDELDLSIHPLVLPEILAWFYDFSKNPSNAQIWFTCQSMSLLEELTKEEVVLCEKDRTGRSHGYSLMDVQSVRRDDNLYKKYLGGAFGAVPHIG